MRCWRAGECRLHAGWRLLALAAAFRSAGRLPRPERPHRVHGHQSEHRERPTSTQQSPTGPGWPSCTSDGGGQSDNPVFSPDGSRLAFTSGTKVYVADQYLNDRQLVLDYGVGAYGLDWSPDGTMLVAAFPDCVDWDCEPDLYVFGIEGAEVLRLTNSPEPEYNPSWSPDGSKIAFDSFVSGQTDVYTLSYDPLGAPENITTDLPNAATQPDWSPDGSKIAFQYGSGTYTSNPDGTGRVFAGFIRRGARVVSGRDQVRLFDTRHRAREPDRGRDHGPLLRIPRIALVRPQPGLAGAPAGSRAAGRRSRVPAGEGRDPRVRPAGPQLQLLFGQPRQATRPSARVPVVHAIPNREHRHGGHAGFEWPRRGGRRPREIRHDRRGPDHGCRRGGCAHPGAADRCQHNNGNYADYNGGLVLFAPLRTTDLWNAGGGSDGSGTVVDFPLRVAVPCVATAGPEGAICSIDTTVDAVIPGFVRERKRMLLQLGQVLVHYGGIDGNPYTLNNNRPLLAQGLFVP